MQIFVASVLPAPDSPDTRMDWEPAGEHSRGEHRRRAKSGDVAEGGSGAAQADAEVWDKAIGPGIDASARTHRQPARGLHRDLIECSVSDRIDVRSLGSKGILSGVVPFCALLAVEIQPAERVDTHHDPPTRRVHLAILKAQAQILHHRMLIERGLCRAGFERPS